MPKQPQDHQTKVKPFAFLGKDGKKHTLPPVTSGAANLTGRDIRDAALGGDVGQLAYLFKALEAAGPDATALDALYDLPQDDMLAILNKWGEYGDGDGASLGE